MAVVLAIVFTAGRAECAGRSVLAKPDGAFEVWRSDRARCQQIAAHAPDSDLPAGNPLPNVTPTGSAATVAGGLIAFAIIDAIELNHQRQLAVALCMRNLGYVALPLSPSEARTLQGLDGPRADDWMRSFLSGDLRDRLKAAAAARITPLPPYVDRPMTQGGLELAAGSLKAATSPVGPGQDVVTAQASRWRTAVLARPFNERAGYIRLTGDAGAIFYQVDYRPQSEPLLRPPGATWCGPVTQTPSKGLPSHEIYCFTSEADGYHPHQIGGYAWYGGPAEQGYLLPPVSDDIVLQERSTDDLGLLAFGLRAVAIKAGYVDLEGYLRRGDEEVRLLRRRLTFDALGQAILPLWSRRLVLSRTPSGDLTAQLDDHGDGRGWRPGG